MLSQIKIPVAIRYAAQGMVSGEHDQAAVAAMPGQMVLELAHRLFVQRSEGLVENP